MAPDSIFCWVCDGEVNTSNLGFFLTRYKWDYHTASLRRRREEALLRLNWRKFRVHRLELSPSGVTYHMSPLVGAIGIEAARAHPWAHLWPPWRHSGSKEFPFPRREQVTCELSAWVTEECIASFGGAEKETHISTKQCPVLWAWLAASTSLSLSSLPVFNNSYTNILGMRGTYFF